VEALVVELLVGEPAVLEQLLSVVGGDDQRGPVAEAETAEEEEPQEQDEDQTETSEAPSEGDETQDEEG
jgi:hypothetical protein